MCDVVLIKKAVPPRIMWQKGWIIDYIKEKDEKMQGVKLVTTNSKSENVEFSRALQFIILLEIIKSKINDIIVDDTNTEKIQTRINIRILLMKLKIRMMQLLETILLLSNDGE